MSASNDKENEEEEDINMEGEVSEEGRDDDDDEEEEVMVERNFPFNVVSSHSIPIAIAACMASR